MRECGRFYEIWLRHLWLVFQCWIKYAKKEAKKAGKKGRRAKRAFRAITISTHRRPKAHGGRRAKRAFRAIPIFTHRWPCAVLPELFCQNAGKREGERSEPSELFRFLRTDVQERLEEGERSEPSELLRFAKFATFCNDCQLLMKEKAVGIVRQVLFSQ